MHSFGQGSRENIQREREKKYYSRNRTYQGVEQKREKQYYNSKEKNIAFEQNM